MHKRDDTVNVLITEFYTSANHGDEAIILGMVKSIKEYIPNAKIKISCAWPSTTEKMTGISCIPPLIGLYGRRALWKVIPFLIGLYIFPSSKWFKDLFPVINDYYGSDIIVCSGGGFLNDNYRPAILGRLLGLHAARRLKKKTFIYASSIGPFNRALYRRLAKYVFNNIDYITVRDKPSIKELSELGVSAPIELVSDAAFSLYSNNGADDSEEASSEDRNKISISVRHWNHFENGSQDQYERAIVEFVDRLTAKGKFEVYFVSTCAGKDGYSQDDRKVAKRIIDRLNDRSNVILINDELGAEELIEFYTKMDLNVGTRMHTNIFALISSTPVVAIRYEDKTVGLMQQFGLERFLTDIETVSADELYSLVMEVLEKKEILRAKIAKHLTVQRENSLKSGEKLVKILCK